MKVKDLPTIINAFGQLGAIEKLPARVSYAVAKNLKKLQSATETYDKVRLEKAKAIGTLNAEGTQYIFEGPAQQEFNSFMQDLGDTEALISLHSIQFEEVKDLCIPAPVFFHLMDFIIEAEEKQDAQSPAVDPV